MPKALRKGMLRILALSLEEGAKHFLPLPPKEKRRYPIPLIALSRSPFLCQLTPCIHGGLFHKKPRGNRKKQRYAKRDN